MTDDDMSNTDDSTPFLTPCQLVAVELASPGKTRDGFDYYTVHYLHEDGSRFCVYMDDDLDHARRTAADCAGDDLPLVDLISFGMDLRGHGQARH